MRIPRIYQNVALTENSLLDLDESASKHLLLVLRRKLHDQVIIFNGQGGEFLAQIIQINKNKIILEILNFLDLSRETKLKIHLAQCLIKPDNFEFIIQKAVELGVHTLTPIISQYSQHASAKEFAKKIIRWQKIIENATEQCERNILMQINLPCNFLDYLKNSAATPGIIMTPGTEEKLINYQIVNPNSQLNLLIGPEGGFAAEELTLAINHGFIPLNMGQSILRAETASIVSIGILQALGSIK